jgi:uncharacterized protein YndB with AHSA1/START domain
MTDEQVAPHVWQHGRVQYWSVDYIAAPRERVFEYLTRGVHTQRYYFGMPVNDPAAEGDAVWFGPDEAASPIVGRVLELRNPERFVHTFRFRHHDEPESTVEFTLHAHGEGMTALETCHHGFASRESGTYNDICGGWPAILSGLKTLLETGKPLEWPEAEEGAEGASA